MINFQQLYRKSGIKTLGQLTTPVMVDMSTFSLPIDSIIHWCDYEGILYGPNNNDTLFKDIVKPIQIFHEFELNGDLGNPRKINYIATNDIKDYHMRSKRTRWLRSIDSAIKDPQSLIVYNYSGLLRNTKYVKSYFSEYHKWYNIFSTITKDINSISTTYNRQHFISFETPKVIPSIQQLNIASEKSMNTNSLKIFNNKDSYLLLELWKFTHTEKTIRDSSLFNNITKDKLMLVNLVIIESNKYTILNLGYLYSFLSDSKDTANLFVLSKQKIDYNQLQKRLLRLIMSVMEVRTVSLAEQLGVDIGKSETEEINFNNELSEQVQGAYASKELPPEYKGVDTLEQDIVDDEYESEEELQTKLREEDLRLDEELAQLNEIAKRTEDNFKEVKISVKDIINNKEIPKLEEGVTKICDKLADDGMLSASEYKRYITLASAYKNIPLPGGKEGETIFEYAQINPDTLKINTDTLLPNKDTVLDKTMLKTSLSTFDSKYIKEVFKKDTFNMVLNVQNAGIAVTDYKVEPYTDVLGSYETHVIKLKPIVGKESTIRFKIPTLNENGRFESNGVKYTYRKQRVDMPIRKISDNEVALTSYYGKTFITRGRRKIHDYGQWLVNSIMSASLDDRNLAIKDVTNSNVFYKDTGLPRAFTAISKEIKSFTCKGFSLNFDYSKREEYYSKEMINTLEKRGSVILGKNNKDEYLTIDPNNTVYIYSNGNLEVYGSIEQLLNLNQLEAPVEYAEVGVFGKSVPVGVVLAYYLGLDTLLKLLKINYRRVPNSSRVTLSINEWSLQFSDETLVFNRDDKLASIILAGFNSYHKSIKMFSVYSFDNLGVYVNLLEANGLSTRFIREIELMNKMFIDPITREILVEMKEPTTYQGLLFRACELLLKDQHPDALDPKFMRIRGYERLAGSVYTELVQSIRYHEGRLGKAAAQIEMNPYSVWKRITEDPSKMLVNEINPIEQLKEVEAVTFAGNGGRNKRSMVKSTRAYHKNDMGVISESTVDSTDVGINMFTSANPQFNSLRGTASEYDYKNNGVTSLVSTSALLSPGSNKDDGKRVNFIAIQASHSVSCVGYHQFTYRTGYDSVIPDRTDSLFALTAKQKGIVKEITDKGIIVEYENKDIQGYELGRVFGAAAGLTIPHHIITPLKTGEVINVGDVIVYNDGFFEPDFFDSKKVTLKNSINVKTVLWESYQTLEDASSISTRVSSKLNTTVTKVKNIVVAFDQSVSKLVKVGDKVDNDTFLCIIEDSITANNNLFTTDSIDTLRLISAQTPKASVKGVIEKVEVLYHGDKKDMSDSLRNIANASDRALKSKCESLNKPIVTGSVDSGMRIDNEPLGLDNMVIKVYITHNFSSSLGDKGVFGNQMKTVFSEVLESDYITEDGELIDAVFGAQSINDRIVMSPYIIGTTNSILEVIAKKAVALYNE